MKKIIATTTINPPTQAIGKFQRMEEWDIVVAGDLKTPKEYRLDRGVYLTPKDQEAISEELSEAVGWNCIQRRNFAVIKAYEMGADIIALVDDDNIPYESWGDNIYIGRPVEVAEYRTEAPAFDPVGATNESHLWHRGFPLQLLPTRDYSTKATKRIVPDVQAMFWNGDPDIDAICRMEHAPECRFDEACFPMAANRIGPFNSQNTFISRCIVKDYFLFPHIGRMDDIWASFYVQAKGARVVYDRPTVYQDRNVHDLVKDMKQEYLGYENNLNLIRALYDNPDAIFDYLPEESARAFKIYRSLF